MTGMEGGNARAREPMSLAQQNRANKKAAFLLGLREDGTLGATCKRTGLSESTIYRWRRDDPEFNEACEEWLHEEVVNALFESMFQIATSTDPKRVNAAVKAGIFLLQALDPETYGTRVKVESTQNINVQIGTVLETRDQLRAKQLQQVEQLKTLAALPSSESS